MLGTTVHEELLDPTRGLRRGSASITREFPLLAKMGEYHLEARTHLLDDKWQYQRMRWPEQGYWLVSNRQRRIPVIYALAKAPAKVVDAYYQAAVALLEAPLRPQLAPLDRDDEFIYYGELFGWGRGAPDFHPRLRRFCSLDPDLADRHVEDLTDRIRGKVTRDAQGNVTRRIPSVAERMAGAFIRLYRRVIQQYRGQIGMETQIAALEAKIDILTQFVATLRSNDDN